MLKDTKSTINMDAVQPDSDMKFKARFIEEDLLVSLLKSKKHFAFTYLYEYYSGALYSVILSIVDDRYLSNDVFQESFIKIWQKIDSYDPSKGGLFSWMHSIVRNSAIDMIRSNVSKKHTKTINNVLLIENIKQDAANIYVIGLHKIVNSLPLHLKQIIKLSYFLGHTEMEIAEELKLPRGTVKTRKRTALCALRKMIKIQVNNYRAIGT